ncbi:MAG: SDR family oxidoreductase [Rubrivivax sp.]
MLKVQAHFGHLDLLINCVGIQREQRLLEVSEDAFDEVMQVNLKAAMFLAQAAAQAQVSAIAAGRAPGRQVHLLSVRAMLGNATGAAFVTGQVLYLDGGLTATQ